MSEKEKIAVVRKATFFAPQSFPKAPQSIDKQRKTSNLNGLLVFSVLANDSNFDRNPLRGAITVWRGVHF